MPISYARPIKKSTILKLKMLNTVNHSFLICIVIETSTKQDMIEVLERKLMGDTQKEKETLIY